MDREQFFNGFYLDDDLIGNYDVEPVPTVKPHAFVDHRQRDLPPECQAVLRKLVAEAFFISRLE